MTHKLAFIFPGQGESHSVGMGKDFYDNFTVAKHVFDEASDILDQDLKKIIFEGPLEKLSQTDHCQMALYVMSMAVLKVIESEYPKIKPSICAGLSLGEYSAATAAEVLSFEQGVRLVQSRGSLMLKACIDNPSTMAVVLGLTEEQVQEAVNKTNKPNELWIANLNCPGQVVVTGSHGAIEAFIPVGKESGAKRVLPLNVSGAFHSPYMKLAADQLKLMLNDMDIKLPKTLFAMNATGKIETDLDIIRKNLILQITQSVRWTDCILAMQSKEVEHYLELGCGKVLAGLNKRIKVSGQTLSINCVSDLKSLESIINVLK